MRCEVTAHLAPAYLYQKSDCEESRARGYHDKEEEHCAPKILFLSASAQIPLRRSQDCYPSQA
jgi:hypothetical protein